MPHRGIDSSIAKLMVFARRIIAHDEARNVYASQFDQWLMAHQRLLTCWEISVIAAFVKRVIATGVADEESISALAGVRDSLASRPRYRSTAVTLAQVIEECHNVRRKRAETAYEQEIIRLIESGATVNIDLMKPCVTSIRWRGRLVKTLAVDPAGVSSSYSGAALANAEPPGLN